MQDKKNEYKEIRLYKPLFNASKEEEKQFNAFKGYTEHFLSILNAEGPYEVNGHYEWRLPETTYKNVIDTLQKKLPEGYLYNEVRNSIFSVYNTKIKPIIL